MIPYGRQDITDADVAAVVEALRSDFITQGERVPAFERRLCEYTGAAHGVTANSATSCLHIACLALGLGPGDTLWSPPVTFVASTNCALYCGAGVEFVDVDPLTANIDPDRLASRLDAAAAEGRLPRALVVVHMGGAPCDMARIAPLARRHGVAVIEDASHAVGARYADGGIVGGGQHADITIFSFHPVKIITTAEGGLALTNDAELAERMRLYRSHGITRDPARMRGESEGDWYYQQVALGFNYRMTELQAALGISQADRLDAYVTRRNELAARYDAALARMAVTPVTPLAGSRSARHLYIVLVPDSEGGQIRRRVFDAMRAAGIGVNVHYIPVHLQPYYSDLGFRAGDFPGAEHYYRRAISLPLYPGLDEASQDRVIDALGNALDAAGCHGAAA